MTVALIRKAFFVLLALFISSLTKAQTTDIPQVQNVVALVTADPSVAIVYWKPLSDGNIAKYIVYYKNNVSGSNEAKSEVINLANSAVIEDLEIRRQYTFTVSVGYIDNGEQIVIGPRSEVTADSNITTSLSTTYQVMESDGEDNVGTVGVLFYGLLLMLSLLVNIILLVMSSVLLRQLKARYRLGSSNNTSLNDPVELKVIRHNKSEADVPSKPEREYSPTIKEAVNNVFGKESPPKEAEEEVF